MLFITQIGTYYTLPYVTIYRAAAYTNKKEYGSAIDDCRWSIHLNPVYAKAYGRLGTALEMSGKITEAISAYKKCLELEPWNTSIEKSYNSILKQSPQSKPEKELEKEVNEKHSPPPSGLPNFGGLDMASMLQNPEMMRMAANMMQSGQLNDLLKNPELANMAKNFMPKK